MDIGSNFREFASMYNVPGWGLLLIAFITLVKIWPIIQKNLFEARETRETRYGMRIRELERDVADCRRECDEHKREMYSEIEGLRRQHRTEQLSLVRTIVELFPNAPQLTLLMRTLELGERRGVAEAAVAKHVGEVIGDAKIDHK